MPSWGAVLNSLQRVPNPLDEMRRKYLGIMHQYTERNVIAYYSGFIQKPRADGTGIDDNDKNALMQAVCGLDRSKGLDLILHTPGGQVAAAESLVSYVSFEAEWQGSGDSARWFPLRHRQRQGEPENQATKGVQSPYGDPYARKCFCPLYLHHH